MEQRGAGTGGCKSGRGGVGGGGRGAVTGRVAGAGLGGCVRMATAGASPGQLALYHCSAA